MEHEKHGCVWPPLRPRGRRPHGELHRSTPKLAVSHHVLLFPSDLHGRTRYHHGHKRGMADALASRLCGTKVFLRLLHGAIYQAPYEDFIPKGFHPESTGGGESNKTAIYRTLVQSPVFSWGHRFPAPSVAI